MKNVIVHYIQKKLHELGSTKVQTKQGNLVRIYDFERTVCDLVLNRDQVDPELFSKTMFRYARKPGRDMHKLMGYANRMGVKDRVRDIFEVLLNE